MGIISFLFFCSVFVLFLTVFSWLVHATLFCPFHCSFFAFFVSVSWKLLYLFSKTISKVKFLITNLRISLKKGECFDFNHSLGS